MALDGVYLSCLRREIAVALQDTRLDKVFMPTREELLFHFRGRSGTHTLYISTRTDSPRVHFTAQKFENPATPPMFCMLLRRRLTGGRFVGIRQDGAERAVYIDLDCVNELGDVVRLTMAVEIMGKHSNFVLLDADNRVIDVLKRVDLSMSENRPLLPGVAYLPPPAMADKLDILLTDIDTLLAAITAKDLPLADALLAATKGCAPVLCREMALRVGDATFANTLDDTQKNALQNILQKVRAIAAGDTDGMPSVVFREDGTPLEYSVLPLLQYGTLAPSAVKPSFSALLDEFYVTRDTAARLRQRTADLHRVLHNTRNRLVRKLAEQQKEFAASQNRDTYRLYADLINANMYAVQSGADTATLINYYDPDCKAVEVPLDPALSASANAARYYKLYRKAQTAERVLQQQMEKATAELAYIETVEDALSRADTAAAVAALREELEGGGYLRAQKKKGAKPTALPPKTFLSDDGFTILVGRSNLQNDKLTTKIAQKNDIWFHVKNIAGSHVIVVCNGQTPPDTTLEQAAILAATHSKAANSKQVPVDYTPVRYVHKPAGAKPGFVIYDTNRTAYVDPDLALAARLEQQ